MSSVLNRAPERGGMQNKGSPNVNRYGHREFGNSSRAHDFLPRMLQIQRGQLRNCAISGRNELDRQNYSDR